MEKNSNSLRRHVKNLEFKSNASTLGARKIRCQDEFFEMSIDHGVKYPEFSTDKVYKLSICNFSIIKLRRFFCCHLNNLARGLASMIIRNSIPHSGSAIFRQENIQTSIIIISCINSGAVTTVH